VEQFITLIQSRGDLIFYGAIFISVAFVTFAITSLTVTWSNVRRRAVSSMHEFHATDRSAQSVIQRRSSMALLQGLLPDDEEKQSELVRLLNGAGFYGHKAVVVFQLIRILTAIALGLATAVLFGRLFPNAPFMAAVAVSIGLTLIGYILPRSIISLRRDKFIEEHRQGFPDFLDLLVICVEAGIGVDSAIERVSMDLARGFPSLSRNLGFMSLELRAGKSTREALDNLAIRLGLEEAKSFATLIQQSETLGSSLVQSLRVYSDEMRAKRLARAEEKAHSLPVKLVLPLALFIFPVILGVTLMPVAMKLYQALGIGAGS